jgi:RNA polymerase sigma-70 factor (ECF subfamily)
MDSQRHEQFARAFVQHQDRVYGYIVTMLPSRHDAEDVFQQTSLILWQKWDQFDPSAKKGTGPICAEHPEGRSGKLDLSPFSPSAEFLRWACGVARNEVRNFLRRRSRDRVVLSEKLLDNLAEVRLEAQPLLEERRGLLAGCMKKLDFIARELLDRCYAERESIKQIARQFRTTPNAIYLRLRRIRRDLMECIEQGTKQEDAP